MNMRRGFTLIECLIVIVIIGILSAIAIPKFSQTKQRAQGLNQPSGPLATACAIRLVSDPTRLDSLQTMNHIPLTEANRNVVKKTCGDLMPETARRLVGR